LRSLDGRVIVTTTMENDRSWRTRAACRGHQSLFFGEGVADQAAAVSICKLCPVLAECRADLVNESPVHRYGVRAALTPEERRPPPRQHRTEAS
jgi:hypothetical protein